jgi:hypothetical protein
VNAAETYRGAHNAELNAAFDTPPLYLDESGIRQLVERALRRAHRAGRDALVRELLERGAEAAETARERENAARAEAARAERRQREAALRDQYGRELAERIELDGTYAVVRHLDRLVAVRDHVVAGVDLPVVRGNRPKAVKRRLAGWRLPDHAGSLEAVVDGGVDELVAACQRIGSELAAESYRQVIADVAREAKGLRAHLDQRTREDAAVAPNSTNGRAD